MISSQLTNSFRGGSSDLKECAAISSRTDQEKGRKDGSSTTTREGDIKEEDVAVVGKEKEEKRRDES